MQFGREARLGKPYLGQQAEGGHVGGRRGWGRRLEMCPLQWRGAREVELRLLQSLEKILRGVWPLEALGSPKVQGRDGGRQWRHVGVLHGMVESSDVRKP
jgi:hypothetical protein